jgi:hypothetical protein
MIWASNMRSSGERAAHPYVAIGVHARIEPAFIARTPFHRNGVPAPGQEEEGERGDVERGQDVHRQCPIQWRDPNRWFHLFGS